MENAELSILLQFAKFSKGFRISDFDEFVQESVGVENLEFFGRLAYPNQWQMRLSNPDLRERLIRMGRTRINNRSCWMYPLNQQEVRGFIHWLPNSVSNDQVMEQLKLYGNVLFIENQERTIKGRKVESDPRYYALMLPHGVIKDTIPHFLKIDGYVCHLFVRGREAACFHCKGVGHLRAECPQYKAKLISYCNRDPNTAPPRLKPRGRRHVKVEIGFKVKTGGDEVSSSADIVCLERDIPVDEETTEAQSLTVLEDQEQVIEEHEETTSSTEKELAETGVLTEWAAKSSIDTSAASFSEETERHTIAETMQQIRKRATGDLRQRLLNFGTEMAQALPRRKPSPYARDQMQSTISEAMDISINLEQEISNDELEKQTKEISAPKEPIERSEEDSNAHKTIKERKEDEIHPTLPTMNQLKVDIAETLEKIRKKTEEMANDGDPTESTVSDTSVLLVLEQTKQAALETIQSTFKRLEEYVKSKATEIPSEESATDTEQKLSKGEMRSKLIVLEQTKQTVSDYFGGTVKKLEEEIASKEIQLTNKPADTYTKLTKDDIPLAYQMLKQATESVGGIFQDTFTRVAGKLEMESEPAEITTEGSAESKSSSKIAESSTKSDAPLKQLKQDKHDIVIHLDEDWEKVVEEAENLKKLSVADKRQKETIQSESDPGAESQGMLKAAEMSGSREESENEAATEKAFVASKGSESHFSKATQENLDELQMNMRKVFTSVLNKDELLLVISTILKQVESEVNEAVEEVKTG